MKTKKKLSRKKEAPLKTEFPGKSEIVPPVENEFGECCYVICMIPSTNLWAAYRRSGSEQGPKYEKITASSEDRTNVALALSEYLVKNGK